MANANVLIDNDKVKVTEWSFEVGDSTGHHIHEYNYIIVPMLDGELRIIDSNLEPEGQKAAFNNFFKNFEKSEELTRVS